MSSWARRVAPFIPIALLCGVAICQLVAAQTSTLLPWKGGGFGMFATIDRDRSRVLRIHGFGPDGKKSRLRLPGSTSEPLDVARQHTRIWPRTSALEQLADQLLMQSWRRSGRSLRWIPSDGTARDPIQLDRVEVSVWRLDYDADRNQVAWTSVSETVHSERP